jgi:hypothetical protein
MTVPVHNLYDFVHQATKSKYFLIYFYPWGQRAINNAIFYQINDNWLDGPRGIAPNARHCCGYNYERTSWTQPVMICHDQEPLNFSLYEKDTEFARAGQATWEKKLGIELHPDYKDVNLRLSFPFSVQKTWILLHSELNSSQLKRYEDTGQFQGAYWWSHAVIARDWYRYAEHDTAFKPSEPKKIFLTYCRDVTGSRQYREQFLKLTNGYQITDHCQAQSFDASDLASADASAIYNVEDFNNTAISVVLETVFDERIHLTEKTLRAIACGHPFMLAAGPGSLKLLRSYGFHTFDGYIDESYDDIQDSQQRLTAIVKEMKRISEFSAEKFQDFRTIINSIAQYNKQRFFSRKFFQQVTDQLKHNVDTAFMRHKGELNFDLWWQHRQWRKKISGAGFESPSTQLIPLYRQHRLAQSIKREQ